MTLQFLYANNIGGINCFGDWRCASGVGTTHMTGMCSVMVIDKTSIDATNKDSGGLSGKTSPETARQRSHILQPKQE